MLDWLPIYPARIATVVLLGAAFQPHYAGNSTITPAVSSWLPTYPHRIERKVQHVSQKPALFQAGRIAVPDAVVPPLSWEGEAPSRLDRRRLPVSAIPAYFAVPFARATQLTQQPSYPDRITRPRVRPADIPSIFFKLEGIPPLLGWKGEQPERVWPKPSLRVANQRAYFFHPEVIPDPPPPGLGFETTIYPNRIYPRVSIRTGQQRAFEQWVVPIPNPPPPTDFTWPASYPDRIYRASAPTTEIRVVPLLPAIVALAQWEPSYPSVLYRVPRLQPQPTFQIGETLAVAITGQWQPVYPDRLARAGNINEFAGFDPLSVAPLLPLVPSCVELFDEVVTTVEIESLVTHASITDESIRPGAIDPEETC